jgi:hypothetical protein
VKRLACIVIVALAVAAGAAAKEGAQAHLLTPLPKKPTPGTFIIVRWRVDVPGPNGTRSGLSAIGMFVRLYGGSGRSTTALARENAGPPYSARIRVPRGGIRGVRFGLAGTTEIFFPLRAR